MFETAKIFRFRIVLSIFLYNCIWKQLGRKLGECKELFNRFPSSVSHDAASLCLISFLVGLSHLTYDFATNSKNQQSAKFALEAVTVIHFAIVTHVFRRLSLRPVQK